MDSSTRNSQAHELAHRHFDAMTGGCLEELRLVVHPDATNRESIIEPPACRGRGPEAWHATAAWLHEMSSDLAWDIHEVVAADDLIAVHATMTGHHTGEHVRYDPAGQVAQRLPATGRPYRVTQSHWLRIADGKIIEHWANRDDLAMALQLGWLPTTTDRKPGATPSPGIAD